MNRVNLLLCTALVALARPASVEGQPVRNRLSLSAATISFPAVTEAHYDAGSVGATSSITFTMETLTGPPGPMRTSTVSIRATGATMGSGKPIADLEWSRADVGSWNGLSTTDVTIESRQFQRNGINDPWNNTVNFRTLLDWDDDGPATYNATVVFTLTITTP